jgi:signal transduction histidine kinase
MSLKSGSLLSTINRWRHSLQWRLVALFILLAVAMTVAFVSGTQKVLSSGWREAVRPLISDYLDRLSIDLGTPPDIDKAKQLVERLPISIAIQGPIVTFDSHPNKRYSNRMRRHEEDDSRGLLLQRRTTDGHIISFGLGDLEWRRNPIGFATMTLAALLLLTALAYFVVRRMLNPLSDIGDGAKRFGQGQFEQSIPIRRADELGDLAQQVNAMASANKAMLEAKRALLLAISHELRSPLTRARINVELLSADQIHSAPVHALLRDLGLMNELIAGLLESERLNDKHSPLDRRETDLPALIQELLDRELHLLEPASKQHQVQFKTILHTPIKAVYVDPARIKVLLLNIISNAARYSESDGRPNTISLAQTNEKTTIAIRDFGSGVEPNQLAQLTEPFYRTDSARQRSTGGVGLGLYICKLITVAHKGTLEIRNVLPGLEIIITIPNAY